METHEINTPSVFKISVDGVLVGIKKSGWNLQQLEIPEEVKIINTFTLANNNLRLLVLPSGLKDFFESAPIKKTLKNIINHSSLLFEWWVKNHKYGDKTLSEIKDVNLDRYTNSDNKPFAKICYSAFAYNTSLQKIITGAFITIIDWIAFSNCCNLKYVEIGENVIFISHCVFNDCPKLKSENFVSHSPVLFDWWVEHHEYNGETLSKMKTIDLNKYTNSDGKPFTIISERTFDKCYCMKNLLFGKDIKQINEQNFHQCSKLDNIQISNRNVKLHLNAFVGINSRTSFYVCDEQIKEKLETIGISPERIFVKPIPVE